MECKAWPPLALDFLCYFNLGSSNSMLVYVEFELELISFVWEFLVFLHFAVMQKHHIATEEAVFSTLRLDQRPILRTHLVKLGLQLRRQIIRPIKKDPTV